MKTKSNIEQLIKIAEINGNQVVSARELHDFVVKQAKGGQKGEDYSNWIKRMLDYGFEEHIDYTVIKYNYSGDVILSESDSQHVSKLEIALTIDSAKEIAMIQRNDKGKIARKYFIACENKLKRVFSLPQNYSEALRQLADTTDQKEKAVIHLNQANDIIESNKPKVVFANSVIGSSNSILIRKFAKDLCDSDFEIGQNRVFQWLRDNKYLNHNNEPYQNYIAQGLFEVKTRSIGSGEETFTAKTTLMTGKGQVYFAEKIKNTFRTAN